MADFSAKTPNHVKSPQQIVDDGDRRYYLHKKVVLHRAVFEMGYFKGNVLNILSERIEKGMGGPNNSERYREALILDGIKGTLIDFNTCNVAGQKVGASGTPGWQFEIGHVQT